MGKIKRGNTLPILKHYNTLGWESRFTLGLNTTKNVDYIEKCFKQKLHRNKFPMKNSVDACLLSQEWN